MKICRAVSGGWARPLSRTVATVLRAAGIISIMGFSGCRKDKPVGSQPTHAPASECPGLESMLAQWRPGQCEGGVPGLFGLMLGVTLADARSSFAPCSFGAPTGMTRCSSCDVPEEVWQWNPDEKHQPVPLSASVLVNRSTGRVTKILADLRTSERYADEGRRELGRRVVRGLRQCLANGEEHRSRTTGEILGSTWVKGSAKVEIFHNNEGAFISLEKEKEPTETPRATVETPAAPKPECAQYHACIERCVERYVSGADQDSIQCLSACKSRVSEAALALLQEIRTCEAAHCSIDKLGFSEDEKVRADRAAIHRRSTECSARQCAQARDRCGLAATAETPASTPAPQQAPAPSSPASTPPGSDPTGDTVSRILDESSPPPQATALALQEFRRSGRRSQRPLAVAANTRGFRLYKADKLDDALPLFLAAASIDPTYGMPRYNAARIYAMNGDVKNCVKFLLQLRRMPGQKKRLSEARTSEGFKKVWDEPSFKAVFE